MGVESENNMELVIQADSVRLIGYNDETIIEFDPNEMELSKFTIGQIGEALALWLVWHEAPDEALIRKIDA